MNQKTLSRFLKADPRIYDMKNTTVNPKWIAEQELIAEATGGMGQDYDYSMMINRDNRGHGTDKGKLPWHPTFSTQSAFSTPTQPGGVWGHDKTGNTFKPTDRMNDRYFQEYMHRMEPNVRIIK